MVSIQKCETQWNMLNKQAHELECKIKNSTFEERLELQKKLDGITDKITIYNIVKDKKMTLVEFLLVGIMMNILFAVFTGALVFSFTLTYGLIKPINLVLFHKALEREKRMIITNRSYMNSTLRMLIPFWGVTNYVYFLYLMIVSKEEFTDTIINSSRKLSKISFINEYK